MGKYVAASVSYLFFHFQTQFCLISTHSKTNYSKRYKICIHRVDCIHVNISDNCDFANEPAYHCEIAELTDWLEDSK